MAIGVTAVTSLLRLPGRSQAAVRNFGAKIFWRPKKCATATRRPPPHLDSPTHLRLPPAGRPTLLHTVLWTKVNTRISGPWGTNYRKMASDSEDETAMALDTAPAAPKNKGKGKVSHDQLDDFGLPLPQAGSALTAETLPWCVPSVGCRDLPNVLMGNLSLLPRLPRRAPGWKSTARRRWTI